MIKALKEQGVPVPRRGKILLITAMVMLMAASIAAGMVFAPKEQEIPVALANGEVITPPWYITVDGEPMALVESKETAQRVLEEVVDTYRHTDKDNTVLDIEVREELATEAMDIHTGDEPPDILTEEEAERFLLEGKGGESCITVVTTEEQTKEETIDFKQEYKPQADMYIGERIVETEGKEGIKEVTSKVIKENGIPVSQEVVEEEIITEPRQEIVLTGTKEYDGYGGAEGASDTNVSYDGSAVYEALYTPVDSVYISSEFGPRWGRMHRGIDLALAMGSAIYAADDGVVYYSGWNGGYGNLVKIDHGNGMQTYYAHCSQLLTSQGQHVTRGEKIALVGSTGNSTGPHLHFEVIINGSCVNPLDFLDF